LKHVAACQEPELMQLCTVQDKQQERVITIF